MKAEFRIRESSSLPLANYGLGARGFLIRDSGLWFSIGALCFRERGFYGSGSGLHGLGVYGFRVRARV